MPDMKSLTINGTKYDIKDATARTTLDSLATVATSGKYSDLTGTPTLATVATSGSYNDLSNKPTIPDVSGYAKPSVANTWTAAQTFNNLVIDLEKYNGHVVSGTSATPAKSGGIYTATGAFTLNMTSIASALSASQFTVYSARFFSSADRTLTISNAGTLTYTGSASDVAIKSTGTLVNIFMCKNSSGTLYSTVQAIALSAS